VNIFLIYKMDNDRKDKFVDDNISNRTKNIEIFIFSLISFLIFSYIGSRLIKIINQFTGFYQYILIILIFFLGLFTSTFYILFLWYMRKVLTIGVNHLSFWINNNWPIIKKITIPVLKSFKWLIILGLIVSIPYIYYKMYLIGEKIFLPALASGVVVILVFIIKWRKKQL